MTEEHNLIRVFSGSMIEVDYIRERLEEIGISSLAKDDFHTGIHAGVPTGLPDTIDIYVDENDVSRARAFINGLSTTL